MELLGDVGPVESRFDPFGDSVSVGSRYNGDRVPDLPSGRGSYRCGGE